MAIGRGNVVSASGAAAIGTNLTNSIVGSLQIGPNEAAKITVLSGGQVGIGTSTPSTKLDVVGTGTFQGLRILSGASNGYVLTSDAS